MTQTIARTKDKIFQNMRPEFLLNMELSEKQRKYCFNPIGFDNFIRNSA